jgi:hypothetical protein
LGDLAYQEMEANKASLLAQAAALNIKGVDAVIQVVTADLPDTGLAKLVKPFIVAAIQKAEPQLIAAAGSEEALLYAAAEAIVQKFAVAHGG